jgi:hypothetical protein
MIKLLNLISEIQQEQQIDEGWRENVVALATAAASLVGGSQVKGQDMLQKQPTSTSQQQVKKDTLDINFGTNFKSGRYSFNQQDVKDLSSKLAAIGNFIKDHPNSNFTVTINSSESKVPNYDLEPGSPNFKSKLDTGELAQKRALSMKLAIQTLISNLKQDGIKVGQVDIQSPQTLVGGPKWEPGMKTNDSAFTKHQYVNFKITASDKKTDFSAFAKMGQRYFDQNQAVTAQVFFKTRATQDITKSGNVDTGKEDVLVRFIDGNTGKYTGEDYTIDSNWWNKNVGPGTTLNNKIKDGIKSVGKKV